MSVNNTLPSKEINSSPQPKQRRLLHAAIVASFLLSLIVAVILMGVWWTSFLIALYIAVPYWVGTLPFTLLAIYIYRKAGLPAQFELLAAMLVVGTGLFLVMRAAFLL